MRRSALVHRFLAEETAQDSAYQTLVCAGLVVALGPGLVAGTPLLDRVLGRMEAVLLEAVAGHGVQRASLPACEGEALVNLLAHLGWAGARTGLVALGTGFREMTEEPDGLHGLALYRRLDVVRLEGGGQAAVGVGDVTAALLLALSALGVPETAVGEDGTLRSGGVALGRVQRRSLSPPEDTTAALGVEELLMLDLDLFAVLGVMAEQRDERGLRWPDACAPCDVALVEAAGGDAAAQETSRKLEAELEAAGFAVLRDDTAEPAAAQRRAAERLGIPVRVLCGPTCAQGVVVLERREGGTPERVPVDQVLAWVERRLGAPPARARRKRALY